MGAEAAVVGVGPLARVVLGADELVAAVVVGAAVVVVLLGSGAGGSVGAVAGAVETVAGSSVAGGCTVVVDCSAAGGGSGVSLRAASVTMIARTDATKIEPATAATKPTPASPLELRSLLPACGALDCTSNHRSELLHTCDVNARARWANDGDS
ncbi:MAG: hypothetical protein KDB16_00475, partial [Acidimicrobiales bacterium]|nr:hypothetical protein [Acidimicrobiales bacterium]